jgi:hypothetical protein
MFGNLLAIVFTAVVTWAVFTALEKWYWSNPRRTYA